MMMMMMMINIDSSSQTLVSYGHLVATLGVKSREEVKMMLLAGVK